MQTADLEARRVMRIRIILVQAVIVIADISHNHHKPAVVYVFSIASSKILIFVIRAGIKTHPDILRSGCP